MFNIILGIVFINVVILLVLIIIVKKVGIDVFKKNNIIGNYIIMVIFLKLVCLV